MKIILLIMSLLLIGCESTPTSKKQSHVGIPSTQEGVAPKMGWTQNSGNIAFNTGPVRYDFDNSPVGKIFNRLFPEKEVKENIFVVEEEEIPLVEVEIIEPEIEGRDND